MIVMKNVSQPYGPSYTGLRGYRGMVIRNPMGMNGIVVKNPMGMNGMVMRNPMGMNGYGIVMNQPQRLPWNGYRGYGDDLDTNQLLNSGIAATPGLIGGLTSLFTTLTGSNKTGTGTVPTTPASIPAGTGYSAGSGSYAAPSGLSSIPTYVWIAGGVLLLGGAAVLLMK